MFSRSMLRTSLQFPKLQQSLPSRPRYFHATTANMVKVGDSIPDMDLREDSPGNKVNLAKELASGQGIIVGVPAAFSPGCSETHVPGYTTSTKLEGAGKIFIVSVNDAFVMKAWGKTFEADKKTGIRFIADPEGAFTRALDLDFDSVAFFGNRRGKRYALKTQDGKITKVSVEEDPSKVTVSSAEENL